MNLHIFILIVSYKVIIQMINHPFTDIDINKFKVDYDKVFS